MKTVDVPEGYSGREITCQNCSKTFEVPARYTPAVLSEAAKTEGVTPAAPPVAPTPATANPPTPTMSPEVPSAPPGYIPPVPPVPVAPAPHAAPPPVPGQSHADVPPPQVAGYTRSCGITVSPRVVAWLPAILLTLTLVCTFFPWVGSYLGGYPVHSQSPWRAVFGSVSRNFALEANMPGSGVWLDKVTSDWGLLVPFLILLFLATGVAWAERGFRGIDLRRIPPVARFWPWRRTVIGGLAGLAFLLVVIQLTRGFGMERAIRQSVRENPEIVKAREEAKDSPAKQAALENREDSELERFNLERTWWQDLALACNFLAVVCVFLSIVLEKRGDKPPPRIVLHY